MAKKILVTGSGGFIFSNFIRNAIYQKKPYEFVSIDKVKQSSVLNNIYNNKNHTFYIGDCGQPAARNRLSKIGLCGIIGVCGG